MSNRPSYRLTLSALGDFLVRSQRRFSPVKHNPRLRKANSLILFLVRQSYQKNRYYRHFFLYMLPNDSIPWRTIPIAVEPPTSSSYSSAFNPVSIGALNSCTNWEGVYGWVCWMLASKIWVQTVFSATCSSLVFTCHFAEAIYICFTCLAVVKPWWLYYPSLWTF